MHAAVLWTLWTPIGCTGHMGAFRHACVQVLSCVDPRVPFAEDALVRLVCATRTSHVLHVTTCVLQTASYFGQKAVEEDVTAMMRCVMLCIQRYSGAGNSDALNSAQLKLLASCL